MNLKEDARKIIESKIEMNSLFEASLDEACERTMRKKEKDVLIVNSLPYEDVISYVLELFLERAKEMLESATPTSRVVWRGVLLKEYNQCRDVLLFQLSRLNFQDVS